VKSAVFWNIASYYFYRALLQKRPTILRGILINQPVWCDISSLLKYSELLHSRRSWDPKELPSLEGCRERETSMEGQAVSFVISQYESPPPKLQVFFAEYRLLYRTPWQKRPIILRNLLLEATPFRNMNHRHRWWRIYGVAKMHRMPYVAGLYLQKSR